MHQICQEKILSLFVVFQRVNRKVIKDWGKKREKKKKTFSPWWDRTTDLMVAVTAMRLKPAGPTGMFLWILPTRI